MKRTPSLTHVVRWAALCISLLCCVAFGSAQEPLTLERIMAHPDWLGRQPENAYWADDGASIYYEQKREGAHETVRHLYQVALDGRLLREVGLRDRGAVDVSSGDWSSDRAFKAYAHQGDVFVKEIATGKITQLTRTEATETEPRYLKGDRDLWFHREGRIFVRSLDTGLEYEPALLKFEKDPSDEPDPNYLREQQDRLIDWVEQQREKKERAREREDTWRDSDVTRLPRPFYFDEDWQLKASSLAPDGRHVLVVTQPKELETGRRDSMPNYVSEDGYIENRDVRALVGTGAPVSDRVFLLNLKTHEAHEIEHKPLPGLDEDPLAAFRPKKESEPSEPDENTESDDPKAKEQEDKERAIRVGDSGLSPSSQAGIVWNTDGSTLVLQFFSHDHKDRWVASVSLSDYVLVPLQRIHDPAWINWRFNEIGWSELSNELFYTSEESGYSQLYLRDLTEDASRRVTDGDFVVSDVQPSPDERYLYYVGNKHHPGEYEVFRYDLTESRNEQVTDLGGMTSFEVSPDGSRLLLTHSKTVAPPELYVQSIEADANAARITQTISSAFQEIDWVEPEIVAIPSTHHDRSIYARIYGRRSQSGDPRPAVVFVHGAGYLQNSHKGWSGYFREFMFHTLLANQGYVVLDMDYRASAGYGRDWRTAIYRQMGTPELEDLQDGVSWLAETKNVDASRVGVYGGSYGGFITFMSMFKLPDLFACGAALRPVTDWAHYNHSYTSRILNTPETDPEAYERSSPLEFVGGLEKPLLIAHGVLDDNVFFKDSVRLVQRLIELEKQDWEMAMYPVEPHGFREPSSWLDEYRRIHKLFERHLKP